MSGAGAHSGTRPANENSLSPAAWPNRNGAGPAGRHDGSGWPRSRVRGHPRPRRRSPSLTPPGPRARESVNPGDDRPRLSERLSRVSRPRARAREPAVCRLPPSSSPVSDVRPAVDHLRVADQRAAGERARRLRPEPISSDRLPTTTTRRTGGRRPAEPPCTTKSPPDTNGRIALIRPSVYLPVVVGVRWCARRDSNTRPPV